VKFIPTPISPRVSLERALSKLGCASRSEARAIVLAGRVAVDGRRVRDPAARLDLARARISVDGRPVGARPPRVVVALHKPRGVLTTRRDPQGRPVVYDLLRDLPERVVAVGRLDFASSGLLLFTNDTRLANRLTDPANAVPRRYVVTVRGELTDEEARRVEEGIDAPVATGRAGRLAPRPAPGRTERLAASQVRILKRSRRETHLEVTLCEGRNRELRRIFDALGHDVTRLTRIAFGDIELGDLEAGKWRYVSTP
jgi:23S rRNA pseudouridine2605 synthase